MPKSGYLASSSRGGVYVAARKLHANLITGQRGINLIEAILLEMDFLWYPTGQIEAGIDGHMDIRDPASGAAR
jgi:hypothetical protein